MPIPLKIREELARDPRMKRCMVADKFCKGRIQWHHAWVYKNNQIQEVWAIGGICEHHHHNVDREQCQQILIARLSDNEIAQIKIKYPRLDMEKKPKKPNKEKRCPKCKRYTVLMICPCGKIMLDVKPTKKICHQ